MDYKTELVESRELVSRLKRTISVQKATISCYKMDADNLKTAIELQDAMIDDFNIINKGLVADLKVVNRFAVSHPG